MRPAAVFLLCLLAGVSSSSAQPFRIATWQLHELPKAQSASSPTPASASGAASAEEDQRWAPVAEVLSAADADVVVLYGVPDADSARRIANQLKPRKYAVALHTAFRHSSPKGPFVGQPVTLLSRKERLAGKNIEWNQTGRIDLPGGFAFATFRQGPSIVSVYVASLPGSLTNGIGVVDGHNMARKRNYAAQYLAHHASWLATTYTNPVVATYLTGDINLTPKNPLPDECAKILEQAGFRALAPGAAQDKAGRSITNRMDMDCVLDPIFTKGIEFAASRQVPRPPPEHSLITCDLTLKSPTAAALKPAGKGQVKMAAAPPAKPASPPAAPAGSAPAPAAPFEPVPEIPAPASAPIAGAAVAPAPAHSRLVVVPEPSAAPATKPVERTIGSAAPAALSSRPPSPAPAPVGAAVNRWFSATLAVHPWLWPAVGGGLLLLVGLVVATRSRTRTRRVLAGIESETPAGDSVFLELGMNSAPASPNSLSGSAILSTPPTTTGNAQNALRRPRSMGREWGRDARSGAEPSEVNAMPHLQRLMRERVVQWLSRQRTQLLDSQEQGTTQVMDLQVRLERIKEHFQKRLVEQQQRIADLDTALRSRERLIKDLLRARPPAGE